jgi:hypothetical protein
LGGRNISRYLANSGLAANIASFVTCCIELHYSTKTHVVQNSCVFMVVR